LLISVGIGKGKKRKEKKELRHGRRGIAMAPLPRAKKGRKEEVLLL